MFYSDAHEDLMKEVQRFSDHKVSKANKYTKIKLCSYFDMGERISNNAEVS